MLKPGRMWVAPGGYHLVVAGREPQTRLRITQEAPENSCRPSVDVLFRSVAQMFSGRALAVVLTGMGQDGLRGCEVAGQMPAGRLWCRMKPPPWSGACRALLPRAGLADAVLPYL